MPGKSLYDRWLDTFTAAHDHPDGVCSLPCPSCGSCGLRLIFIVRTDTDETGKMTFWCDSCLHGLFPNRALIPPRGVRIREGEIAVPNFAIVSELKE